MCRYVLRRLVYMIPTLLLITVAMFILLEIMPGDPLAMYMENPNLTAADMERLARQLGLDGPLHERYIKWLGRFVQGDWGYSFVTRRPVLEMITERLPNTLALMAAAYVLTLLVAVPAGVISAVKQYSVFDFTTMGSAFVCLSVPTFWLGLVLIMAFSVHLRLLPAGGMATLGSGFSLLDRVRHMILPVIALSMQSTGVYARYVRAGMLEILSQDYVRTARAKGLRERVVVYKHAFRNAMLPFVTVAALQLPDLFTGGVVTEMIFTWPGMGRLFWDAATRVDYPVIMGVSSVTAILVLLSNLLADILYAVVDPRIRYE